MGTFYFFENQNVPFSSPFSSPEAKEAAEVYCARCGRVMSLIHGVFTCVSGDMPLSPAMHATLTQRFPVQRSRPSAAEVGPQFNRWYCPGCGLPLSEGMVCTACGLSIPDQVFHLVELHPHSEI